MGMRETAEKQREIGDLEGRSTPDCSDYSGTILEQGLGLFVSHALSPTLTEGLLCAMRCCL